MKSWESNRFLQPGALILCLMFLSSVLLSAQVADSTDLAPEKQTSKAVSVFLAPTLLIGAGIATMYDRGFYSSYDAYDCIQRNFSDFNVNIEDFLMFVPAAGVYGLNWAGVKGKNNFLDRSLLYISSMSLALATTTIIKNTTDVLRPDGSDYKSMPSNHTAIAFISATFLHEEFKELSIWYGVAGYTVATATGVLRMLNNKHWMSDVLVGAGLGILTTKSIYWLYPVVKERLGNRSAKKSNNNLSLVPYFSPKHYGVFLQYNIQPFKSL